MESTELGTLDLSFDQYTQRQLIEISPEILEKSIQEVRPSGHFQYLDTYWEPQLYEGFAIISMLEDNPGNHVLDEKLREIQKEIGKTIQDTGSYYSLPPSSFHQTIANTLSAERFYKHVKVPGLEQEYPEIIQNSFRKIRSYHENEPIRMSMVGLSIFKTALGILGIFKKEDDYLRILNFRQKLYSYHPLQELGVRMTRPFIGHITLGYFEKALNETNSKNLLKLVEEINADLFNAPPVFFITQTGLRKYQTLAQFDRKDHFPYHKF